MTQPRQIAGAEELCCEDAGTRQPAEYRQIEDKEELVGDGHAGKLRRARLSDHDVVEQTQEIRDGVLYDDGDDKREH